MATGNSSVKQLSQELLNYEKEIRKLSGQLSKLEQGSRKYDATLKKLIKTQNDSIRLNEKLEKKGKTLIRNNKNHKSSIEQLEKAQKKYNATLKSSTQLVNSSGAKQSSYIGKIGKAIGTLGAYALAYRAIAAAMSAVDALTLKAVKRAVEFEKGLANLSAVAGLGAESVRVLGENALDVAGKTKFTSTQIIGLQTELAKLGYTSREIVDATEGIAFAAQALGAPLNTMAESIGKVINQFGLLKTETDFVGDVLVTTINNSALSFESFGTAIQYVGPIAKNLGLDLQQTAGAMAVLADSGFTASRVGTGLRGILTEIGKTSVDAQDALQQLAKDNISLSEAVELVGKRNAAQLVVLLKNIDAIDESTESYYQQGRAFEAAAKQGATFAGQVDIMNSAFEKFQINIGKTIAESNFVVVFLEQFGGVFQEAAASIRAFQSLADIGFDKFAASSERAAKGANPYIEALDLLAETDEEVAEKAEYLRFQIEKNGKAFANGGNISNDLANKINGLGDAIDDSSLRFKKSESRAFGSAIALQSYGKEVERFKKQSKEQKVDVEAVNDTFTKLTTSITGLSNTEEKYANELENSLNLSKERKEFLEIELERIRAEKKEYSEYADVLTNILGLERQREEERKKAAARKRQNDFRRELKEIQDRAKEEVDLINEQARVQTELAKTADERAEIEANRSAAVAKAYKYEEQQILGLKSRYAEFAYEIEQAADKAAKMGDIKQSEVIEKVKNAVADYAAEIENLDEKLANGEISQEEYIKRRDAQYDAIFRNIEEFQNLVEMTPELEAYFKKLADEAMAAGYAIAQLPEEYTEAQRKAAEKAAELEKDKWIALYEQINKAVGEAYEAYAETAKANREAELQEELDRVKRRYEIEEQILKASLENQFITESQYRAKSEELKKAELRKQNDINREIFNNEKKFDQQNIAAETLQALASNAINNFEKYDALTAGIQTTLGYATIVAAGAAKANAVARRKFVEAKFEQGGMVEGPSHAQGGIPFTVQGQGGYEMEGGEFIVNKKAASLHRQLLESINNSVKPTATVQPLKFATGGVVNNTVVNNSAGESVHYLKAIAEATTSTAIQTSKPVRAFVSSKDLRTNDTERTLRERNDRI